MSCGTRSGDSGNWAACSAAPPASCRASTSSAKAVGYDCQHGLQFKTSQLRGVPARTLEGIEKYLASGIFKGIGPHVARKLVRAFGEQGCDVIGHEPVRLLSLEGSSPERKEQVTRAWTVNKVVHEIMVFLQTRGVGSAGAVRIYKTYGEQAFQRKVSGLTTRLTGEFKGTRIFPRLVLCGRNKPLELRHALQKMFTPLSQRDLLAHPLSRTEEVAHFINDSAKTLRGVKALEAQRRIIPLLDTAVILLNGVTPPSSLSSQF